MICENFVPNTCSLPPTPPLNLTGWFSKPKPNPLPPPKKPSGNRVKVLHLSDFHIDPRASQSLLVFIVSSGYRAPVPEWSGVRPKSSPFLTLLVLGLRMTTRPVL